MKCSRGGEFEGFEERSQSFLLDVGHNRGSTVLKDDSGGNADDTSLNNV
ncbi:hypothetical protein ACKFKF_23645 [Phormidesmis sp. 146-12]